MPRLPADCSTLSLTAIACILLTANATAQPGSFVGVRDHWRLRDSGLTQFTENFATHDNFGRGVAAIGDVNGDLIPDIAISAARRHGSGELYICCLSPGAADIASYTAIVPPSRVSYGTRLGALGDIDGNGVPDLAATGSTTLPGTLVTSVSIILLERRMNDIVPKSTVTIPKPANLPIGGFGYEPSYLAHRNLLAVGAIGDVGNTSQKGAIVLMQLSPTGDPIPGTTTILDSTSHPSLAGIQPGGKFGWGLSWVGDIDGNGHKDLAVGEPYADSLTAGDGHGKLWILLMDSTIAGGAGATVIGAHSVDGQHHGLHMGSSVDLLGDVNANGNPEILVACQASVGGSVETTLAALELNYQPGTLTVQDTVYIHNGWSRAVARGGGLCETPPPTLFGEQTAVVGDLDGNGVPDAIVGAYQTSIGSAYAGAAYVVTLNAPRENGVHTALGAGCGGTSLIPSGIPNLSETVTYTMTPVNGTPLIWLNLAPRPPVSACSPCTLYIDVLPALLFPTGTLRFQIPCEPSLVGTSIYLQGADVFSTTGCQPGDPVAMVSFSLADAVQTSIGL